MKEAGVKLVVPLVSQGELIGDPQPRAAPSQQEYSADDRKLLDLATQTAPAVRWPSSSGSSSRRPRSGSDRAGA